MIPSESELISLRQRVGIKGRMDSIGNNSWPRFAERAERCRTFPLLIIFRVRARVCAAHAYVCVA